MIEQLKTIRELFDNLPNSYGGVYRNAFVALTQLEAMVGEQKPVAYAIFAENGNIRLWSTESQHVKRIAQEKGLSLVPLYAAPVAQQQEPDLTSLLFAVEQAVKNGHCPWEIEAAFHEYEAARRAAPVAQQYEAGDMASAAAQGFRDGVASVAQQPPKLEDIEQYRMQMAGICTAATGYWKDGDSIHPDYDTPALRDVAKLYAKYDALYKAQQPQAEPLGETPTPAKSMAAPVASWDDSRTQKVYEVLTNDNYPPKGSADHWEGWKARLVVDALFPEQPQAEAVSDDLRDRLVAIGAAIADQDDRAAQAMIREILAAPQQAEAVPPDVVRDATAYHWLTTTLTSPEPWVVFQKAFGHMTEERPPTKAELDAAIYAAIAQQKGGV